MCSSGGWLTRHFTLPARHFQNSTAGRHVPGRTSIAFAFLILLVLGAPQLSAAQDVKSTIERLDPMVTFVITRGEWHRGDEAGRVRIIVTSGGFEHVTSVLYVQWMLVDSDSGRMRIIRTEEVKEFAQGSWALTAPRIDWQGGKWNATVDGADSHAEQPRVARWRLDIGAPGEVRVSPIPRSG